MADETPAPDQTPGAGPEGGPEAPADSDDLLDLSADDLGPEEPTPEAQPVEGGPGPLPAAPPPAAPPATPAPPTPPTQPATGLPPVQAPPSGGNVLNIDLEDLPDEPARPAPPGYGGAPQPPGAAGPAHKTTGPSAGRPLTGPVSGLPGVEMPKAKARATAADAVVSASLNVLPLALAGGLGGLLAWGLLEPFMSDLRPAAHSITPVLRSMALYGGVTGGLIGAALGCVEGITSADILKALRGFGLGLAIGLVGGAFGGVFAQLTYGGLGGGRLILPLQMIVRALGWGVIGLFVGLAPGLLARARKKVLYGALGGLVGGLIAGFLFDPIGYVVGGGSLSRMIGEVGMGIAAGLAIGLIEQVAKEAWLVISAGPLTGKQFILYNQTTTIGRSPSSDIALVKETAAAAAHCRVVHHGSDFVLEDLSGAGTVVSGQTAARKVLRSGDVVQIGKTALSFYERAVTPKPR